MQLKKKHNNKKSIHFFLLIETHFIFYIFIFFVELNNCNKYTNMGMKSPHNHILHSLHLMVVHSPFYPLNIKFQK